MENVAILGASNNPGRYSYKAQILLVEKGHTVYPVSLNEEVVLGIKATPTLQDIKQNIDTVTVYINPNNFHHVINDIIELMPKRIIFNPGSESPADINRLAQAGIEVESACTLVLLQTEQF